MGIEPTAPPQPTELIITLAHEARRESILSAVWEHRRDLTLERLDTLLQADGYGADIGRLTIRELLEHAPTPISDDDLALAFVRKFEQRPGDALTSHYFVRCYGVPSWTAQRILGGLVERGFVRREGKTSGTRYRLASKRKPRTA